MMEICLIPKPFIISMKYSPYMYFKVKGVYIETKQYHQRYACWYFCYILQCTWHILNKAVPPAICLLIFLLYLKGIWHILKQSSITSGMHVDILLYFKGHLAYIETKQYHQRYACWYFCYILKYTWHMLIQSSSTSGMHVIIFVIF